ncbi:ABC transporter permease [Microbacterium sp. AZCO]|uniref:ABC transporter permease n=1 Tax=Microbacterium sp. AZCO TaxID=3142976 RepID=UPI0031F40B64
MRAEWIKLTSLRSTWWSIASVAALSIGLSLMIAAASASLDGAGMPADAVILAPTQFTMLLAGALGAIAVTGEYSTGQIRSTLTAEPRRGAVLLAKSLAVAAFVAVSTAVILVAATLATAPILGDAAMDWSDPKASLVPLAAGVLSMTCFALIGTGIGFALRSGPGAISVTVAILFILPILPGLIAIAPGWEWIMDAGRYLPTNASQVLMMGANDGGLSVGVAGSALFAWTIGALALGYGVLRMRDA